MPTGSEAELRATWRQVAGSSAAAGRVYDDVVARYAAPHRQYHGGAHVRLVVADARRLTIGLSASAVAAVVLAAFFHDAVYDPRSMTNETDSADLARRRLRELDLADETIDEVARLVLLTADHSLGIGDLTGAALLDADLAVLGSSPAVYSAYSRAVRCEFAHVDDRAWRHGRRAVLERFLARPVIFHTAPMRAHEARARANLAAEIAQLDVEQAEV